MWDENRRVYPETGGVGRGPIWREHFRPVRIIGESRVSWILQNGRKLSKKVRPPDVATGQAEIDDREWVHVHRHRIAEQVDRVNAHQTLRQVAALVGYEPQPRKP